MQSRVTTVTAGIAPHGRRTGTGTVDVAPALELSGRLGPLPVPGLNVRRGPLVGVTRHPLVLVDGAVLQRMHLGRRTGAELLGPGDVLTVAAETGGPWQLAARALTPATFAVVGLSARHDPRPVELDLALLSAASRRMTAALEQRVLLQLPQLQERLAALLPRLAQRWGVVTADGVLLPEFLRHRVLAELTGVRRPSFTTVAARLSAEGSLVRLPDGRWRLGLDAVAV